jgi:lipopolysaccharide transport system permease protein
MTLIELDSEPTEEQNAAPAPDGIIPVTIIEPSHGWVSLKLADLWEYRELLYFLTWREVKVRYKQTALGAAWAGHPAAVHHARLKAWPVS